MCHTVSTVLRKSNRGWTLTIPEDVICDAGWNDKSKIYIHVLGDGAVWLSQEDMTSLLEEIGELTQKARISSMEAHLSVEDSLKRL
jgi:hypothetical protein